MSFGLISRMQNFNFSTQMDLDMSLLRFTSIFFFLYMIFTIITGCFHVRVKNFPNCLNVIDGIVSIVQICMQIAFIYDLKHKVQKIPNWGTIEKTYPSHL